MHNAANSEEPLFHFLGLPFDVKYVAPGQQTQLEAITETQQAYEAEHPDFTMRALSGRGVAMIALMRRIKGSSAMPMAWGFMRDGTLPRKTVDGDSYVGGVDSGGGQLGFGRSVGIACSVFGVGLSVGPKSS